MLDFLDKQPLKEVEKTGLEPVAALQKCFYSFKCINKCITEA